MPVWPANGDEGEPRCKKKHANPPAPAKIRLSLLAQVTRPEPSVPALAHQRPGYSIALGKGSYACLLLWGEGGQETSCAGLERLASSSLKDASSHRDRRRGPDGT